MRLEAKERCAVRENPIQSLCLALGYTFGYQIVGRTVVLSICDSDDLIVTGSGYSEGSANADALAKIRKRLR